MREGLDLLVAGLLGLCSACAMHAEQHQSTLMVGRTLLQQALPITFGLKAARWLALATRQVYELSVPLCVGCENDYWYFARGTFLVVHKVLIPGSDDRPEAFAFIRGRLPGSGGNGPSSDLHFCLRIGLKVQPPCRMLGYNHGSAARCTLILVID